MRLALVAANLCDIGGVENHIRFLGSEMRSRGHDLRLFKPTWRDDVARARGIDDGIPSTIVDLGPKPYRQIYLRPFVRYGYLYGFVKRLFYSLAARDVVEAVSAWAPDLVWQHDLSSSWVASRLLSRTFPVVLTNHTGEYLLLQQMPGATLALRTLLSHYSAVIGPSRELTPSFGRCSRTIHNGVDLGFFSPLSEAEQREQRDRLLGEADRNRFVVFCPRRWAPSKGVVFIARALRRWASAGERNILVVFAGSDHEAYPAYADEIRAALAGCEGLFRTEGNLDVSRMRDWYRIADLVAIPSLMEAVSLSALEAMACGAPVLSTSVGGMPEIIDEGRTGFLVPPADDEALAAAVVRAKREALLLARVRDCAMHMIRSRYGWDDIAAQTEQILESAVSRHG